jgi:hypothetical protein
MVRNGISCTIVWHYKYCRFVTEATDWRHDIQHKDTQHDK